MLLTVCKSCQYCLETFYWKCCEEKFCFDETIATFELEEEVKSNGVKNMGVSVDTDVAVREQPQPQSQQQPQEQPQQRPPAARAVARHYAEIPVHADKLYEVFSKSLIFRQEHELNSASASSAEALEDIETKSEPDLTDKPNRSRVYFEDEVNSPVTDFEIMFKDELMASYDMFKIDEEEESRSRDDEEGLTMNVAIRKQDVIKPSTITIKDENKITTPNPVYEYDPLTLVSLPSTLAIPRMESVKGILRQKGDLPRSFSARTLERVDSGNKLYKQALNRVETLTNIDPNKINKVLEKVPTRSASFLNIPEHLVPVKPPFLKSKSAAAVTSLAATSTEHRLSALPDTPIIKSVNLPRFFADGSNIPEYRDEISLQSIKQKTSRMFLENDLSMPRYYGTVGRILEPTPMHESKSMPDLRNPATIGKVSKRLVKLRSRLKPLVIKKGTEEKL